MIESEIHALAIWTEMAFGALVCVLLLFIVAPYGRHGRPGWGPTLPARWAWLLMEAPTVFLFVPIFLRGKHSTELVPLVFLALWLSHYAHRTLIFPFRFRGAKKRVPLLIVFFGISFNSLNVYIISRWLSHLGTYPTDWLRDPRFIFGCGLFALGYAINRDADATLIRLRGPGESGYKIPHGRLYQYISCPNYFGEIVSWCGFAIATWSLPGLAFAFYTAANVGPRALSHHRWYRENFPDYPSTRKALVPFVL